MYAAAVPFLDRFRAFARESAAPVPKPAGAAQASAGAFRVGAAPRLLAPRVREGLYLLAAGLLALIALAFTGLRRRRRERAAAPTVEQVDQAPIDAGHSPTWQQIE